MEPGAPLGSASAASVDIVDMAIVAGYVNVFPRDTSKGPGGNHIFTPHPLTVVYPTGELARIHGDRRAAFRAVQFSVGADEYFQVQRAVDPDARHKGMVGIGNFIDYTDAYHAMVEDTPAGHRAEIRLMVPTRTEVEVTGRDGNPVVFGETFIWSPVPIAERLRLVESDR
jgi:hypothetical protein